jgi:hypothetical protein
MLHRIDLAAFSLERIAVDYGIECILQSANQWVSLRFHSAMLSDVVKIEVDQTDSVLAILRLLHQELVELIVNDEGVLNLAFKNGVEFRVCPTEEFEAWELSTSEGVRWVCMPGGKIAEWG